MATNSIFLTFVSLSVQALISPTFQPEHALSTVVLDSTEIQLLASVKVVILAVLLAYHNLNVSPALQDSIFLLEPV